IAHLGTADCCIHPPGRNEMIAITPPKIFSKEVAQNRPPHFPARASLSTRNRFTPNFRGWGLDENLKLKSPPYRGVKRARTNCWCAGDHSSLLRPSRAHCSLREMRWTVPVPIPSDLATFKIQPPSHDRVDQKTCRDRVVNYQLSMT